uniref:NRF domain-containing protein n=1 Tax=Rhabditophanes sp. KR3021 TaxID=114890 RepID=A0AC35UAU4_9BILA
MKSWLLFVSVVGLCYGEYNVTINDKNAVSDFMNDVVIKFHDLSKILLDSISLITDHESFSDTYFNLTNVREDCLEDMNLIVNELVNFILTNRTSSIMQDAIIPMIDSTGKIPIGILRGNTYAIGLVKECQRIRGCVEGRRRPLEGAFTRISINLPFANKKPFTGKCIHGQTFTWDLCLPKSCQKRPDLQRLVDSFNFSFISELSPVCDIGTFDDLRQFDSTGYLILAIFAFFAAWSILASIFQFYFRQYITKNYILQSTPIKIFEAMSLFTNLSYILTLPKSRKTSSKTESYQKPTIIKSLYFLRFLSMCHVIASHTFSFIVSVAANPKDVQSDLSNIDSQFFVNGFFAVDTFFFMSGLVFAFTYFKQLKANQLKVLSFGSWILIYIHRFIRLSAPYYMIIIFYTWVYQPLFANDQPLYLMHLFNRRDPCITKWWLNLLYLNNFIQAEDQCYVISWYLAVDFQIFLMSPLFVVPFALGKRAGLISCLSMVVASTCLNIWSVYYFYFPPAGYAGGWMDPRMKSYDDYSKYMYSAPWIRCQVYIIGIVVGYVLQMKKSLSIPRVVNVLLWILSFTFIFLDIVCLKCWVSGHQMSLLNRALYSAFSKIVWAICLSWIVVASFFGYGGIINNFMSMKLWAPLGKVTYSTFLVHFMILSYIAGSYREIIIYYSLYHSFINIIIPVIVMSYLIGLVWAALFEIGIGKVTNILLVKKHIITF